MFGQFTAMGQYLSIIVTKCFFTINFCYDERLHFINFYTNWLNLLAVLRLTLNPIDTLLLKL